jgi:hypothetical protein
MMIHRLRGVSGGTAAFGKWRKLPLCPIDGGLETDVEIRRKGLQVSVYLQEYVIFN